jgi:NADP-dependent 3-hydroxy acid dehydrogenase YdfG
MLLTPESGDANGPESVWDSVGRIHPGAVETEFSEVRFKGDTEEQLTFTKGLSLCTEDIADIIHFGF